MRTGNSSGRAGTAGGCGPRSGPSPHQTGPVPGTHRPTQVVESPAVPLSVVPPSGLPPSGLPPAVPSSPSGSKPRCPPLPPGGRPPIPPSGGVPYWPPEPLPSVTLVDEPGSAAAEPAVAWPTTTPTATPTARIPAAAAPISTRPRRDDAGAGTGGSAGAAGGCCGGTGAANAEVSSRPVAGCSGWDPRGGVGSVIGAPRARGCAGGRLPPVAVHCRHPALGVACAEGTGPGGRPFGESDSMCSTGDPGCREMRSADGEHVEEQPGEGEPDHGQPDRSGHGVPGRVRERQRQRGARGLLRRPAGQGGRRLAVRGGRAARRGRRRGPGFLSAGGSRGDPL